MSDGHWGCGHVWLSEDGVWSVKIVELALTSADLAPGAYYAAERHGVLVGYVPDVDGLAELGVPVAALVKFNDH